MCLNISFDTPSSSLMDLTTSPKVKTIKEKRIGMHSLVHNTSGVKGACYSFGIKTRKIEKQINYSHRPIQNKQQVH
jgi:hypothetical protein